MLKNVNLEGIFSIFLDLYTLYKIIWCLRGDRCEPFVLFCLFCTKQKEYLLIRLYNSMNDGIINRAVKEFLYLETCW